MNYAMEIGNILTKRGWWLSTAESCTGGLLSSKLTDIPGSSAYIKLNLVTYANQAKTKVLGVKESTLQLEGAVSKECSYEMAEGLYKLTRSEICVSTTGIAGPTGGSKDKPVGLMYSTIYAANKFQTYEIKFPQDTPRKILKEMFANEVLKNIYEFLK